MPSSNSVSQTNPKTCVAWQWHSCKIYIWWPYLTRPWPWPLLSIQFILICYLLHTLGSLMAKFGIATVLSPISEADEVNSDDFDLWPNIDLTCDLFKIFVNTLNKYLLKAFDLCLTHLTIAADSWVNWGRGFCCHHLAGDPSAVQVKAWRHIQVFPMPQACWIHAWTHLALTKTNFELI